jgi:molybdopterin synthase catalytic subunit
VTWASIPSCGAVVLFVGTVRDHAPGRPDVTALAYEAYEEHAVSRLRDVAAAARERWRTLGRIALLHRVGELAVGEVSVAVVASAPHREEAFEAARFCIDTLKETVPIWKRETWAGGEDWSLQSQPLRDAEAMTP